LVEGKGIGTGGCGERPNRSSRFKRDAKDAGVGRPIQWRCDCANTLTDKKIKRGKDCSKKAMVSQLEKGKGNIPCIGSSLTGKGGGQVVPHR